MQRRRVLRRVSRDPEGPTAREHHAAAGRQPVALAVLPRDDAQHAARTGEVVGGAGQLVDRQLEQLDRERRGVLDRDQDTALLDELGQRQRTLVADPAGVVRSDAPFAAAGLELARETLGRISTSARSRSRPARTVSGRRRS